MFSVVVCLSWGPMRPADRKKAVVCNGCRGGWAGGVLTPRASVCGSTMIMIRGGRGRGGGGGWISRMMMMMVMVID